MPTTDPFYYSQYFKIFGFNLLFQSPKIAARNIVECAHTQRTKTINFINAHCVNIAAKDSEYRSAVNKSDHLLPDGSGMKLAARLLGENMGPNLNGTDLFPLICAQAEKEQVSIYLHGGAPGIARKAAQAMQKKYPNLMIAGTSNGFDDHADTDSIIDKINQSRAGILLVGMGVPHQEKWLAQHRHKLRVPVVMGVGGLFDYYSGNIPRAPEIVRKWGAEWMWRLMMEPRRLAGRYLVGNVKFIAYTFSQFSFWRGLKLQAYYLAKRAFDISASLAALTLLSPFLLLIAAIIKAEDRGPIFFRQVRIGRHGKPFHMWKFRSMSIDAEARLQKLLAQSDRKGSGFKMKNDPRVTNIGGFIRRYSIDELPQLFNILSGDMSVVGPRPSLASEVLEASAVSHARLRARPGLTCSWQVSGRAEIPYDQQCNMDIEYVNNPGLFQDIKLVFRTIPAILFSKGAY
ncbi:UDP-phosphate galactose phosphotransferase [Sphingorhabdus lutea]|uniref:UDP-phosphate galactose phosphotransferase n=2 Tax=Sphingorhabdus lutea TaxID=1913578 RepID=A0A1L3JEC5_9SPHN|nr:UDP-phosphate galactose phosphotransferase [Sphingorhabdus lutea]